MSASHLSRATFSFGVDSCQFGPNWMFGLKMELMACPDLVGGTTEQICFFLTLYYTINDMKHFRIFSSNMSHATFFFVVDCCQCGPSWLFGLKMELMACPGLVGGTIVQGCILIIFYDSINGMKHF